jgi:transcriptional regulator with XRE-family HTH domain
MRTRTFQRLFAVNLRRRRQQLGLTIADLARLCRVQVQAVSTWERGVKLPRLKYLLPLADALNVTVDVLLVFPEKITCKKRAAPVV